MAKNCGRNSLPETFDISLTAVRAMTRGFIPTTFLMIYRDNTLSCDKMIPSKYNDAFWIILEFRQVNFYDRMCGSILIDSRELSRDCKS